MITNAGGCLRLVRRLTQDRRGSIIILFTIMVPVLISLIGLSLEVGRYLMLNSQLQDLADAAALAGAKELDGASDAISRATAAADAFSLKNRPWWSDVALSGIQIETPIFYSDLDVVTTNPAKASYIKVTTVQRGVLPELVIAAGVLSSEVLKTSATATAVSNYVACNVQPLMLCNPFEKADGTGEEFKTAYSNGQVKKGMQFHMKILNDPGASGSNQSYAPGDFGLLDPPGCNSSGANTDRDLLSQMSPNFCYVNNVSPRTGQAVQKVNDGINVRFDLPVNGNGTSKACNGTTTLDTSPAPDVIKGLVPQGHCPSNLNKWDPDISGNPPGDTGALPRDSNATPYGNMTIGDGVLKDPDIYWQYHHGAPWPSDLKAAGQPNRWLAYQRELTSSPMVSQGAESAAPSCNAVNASENVKERRLISVAVVDCYANGVKGNSVTNVRTNTYIDLFVTEPSTQGDLWGELVRVMTPESDGTKLHHIVELVRDQ